MQPVVIQDSRRRTILRGLAGLGFGLAAAALEPVLGLGLASLGSLLAAVTVGVNLWVGLRPGTVTLTERSVIVRRLFTSCVLDWEHLREASVSRAYSTRLGLLLTPVTGWSWVQLWRRDGGPPVKVYGAGASAEALRDAILQGWGGWRAARRAIFKASGAADGCEGPAS